MNFFRFSAPRLPFPRSRLGLGGPAPSPSPSGSPCRESNPLMLSSKSSIRSSIRPPPPLEPLPPSAGVPPHCVQGAPSHKVCGFPCSCRLLEMSETSFTDRRVAPGLDRSSGRAGTQEHGRGEGGWRRERRERRRHSHTERGECAVSRAEPSRRDSATPATPARSVPALGERLPRLLTRCTPTLSPSLSREGRELELDVL